jgi:hypothetical protein
LGDPRRQEVFDNLKAKYKEDAHVLKAINSFEAKFKESTIK